MSKRCNCKPENSTDEPCECGDCSSCRETDSGKVLSGLPNKELRSDIHSGESKGTLLEDTGRVPVSRSNKDLAELKKKYRKQWSVTAKNVWWEKAFDEIYEVSRKETLTHIREILSWVLTDVYKRSLNNHEWAIEEIREEMIRELTALLDSPQTGADA